MSEQVTIRSILNSESFSHIKEALSLHAQAMGRPQDLMRPIRETPLSVFYAKGEKTFINEVQNPNLPAIWKDMYNLRIGDQATGNMYNGGRAMKETVSVPNTLSALKIFDEVLEGAEPWSEWKQYTKIVNMDTPKVTVPITKYTDVVGADKGLDMYAENNQGAPKAIGGKITPVELDCSGTKNSFRGAISVSRNDVKDNNFLAVEQSLKNAGNDWYFKIGKKIIDKLVADTTVNTGTKASLDNSTPVQSEFEALINVIRGRFPGTQRNRADTMFIHPNDAAKTVSTAGSNGSGWPLLDRLVVGPTDGSDAVNNSGLAKAFGLKQVFETPQITQGIVMITKRDIAQVLGLREDLTIEDFDLTVQGLYDSALVSRLDIQEAHEDGAFKITSF